MERGYRHARKALKLLTETQFFQAVADSAGYVDTDIVKRIYNGMIDVTYRELREKGSVRFPQLCDFHLLKTNGKWIKNHRMPLGMWKPPWYKLHIRAMYSVKRYFKAFTESHPETPHDPREKMDAAGIEYKKLNKGLTRNKI